ncbi:MAG: hypothetical protein WC549_07590 [Actinomycetota bacterium]
MPTETEKGNNILNVAKKKRHMYLLEKLQKGKSLSVAEFKELESFEGNPIPPGIVRTQREIAEAFHVSKRTIENWVSDGMPRTKEGYYNLLEINTWKENKGRKDIGVSQKELWDTDFRKTKAKLAEIELKKKTGELISLEDVDKGRVERVLVIKQALLALPKAMAPVLAAMDDPRDIQEYVNGKMRDMIAQFSGQNIKDEKPKVKK